MQPAHAAAATHTHTHTHTTHTSGLNPKSLPRIGADLHRAMVVTAPGEKLLIGRRSVRNWSSCTISSVYLCRKLHLFLGKSTKTAAIRAALFDSNMHQIVYRLRLRPRPHWGSLLYLGGLLLKGGEGKEFVVCRRKKKKSRYLCCQ